MPAYANLFVRLTSNTHEPDNEQSCWVWKNGTDRWGYARLNVYVPGLARAVTLMAHLVAFVWLEARCATPDEMYLAYIELRESGLELDHGCHVEACIKPDHLDPVTKRINCQRRDAYWREQAA